MGSNENPRVNPIILNVVLETVSGANNITGTLVRYRSVTSSELLHTWLVLFCDQYGIQDSVEQAHCTLSAVKRYWDTTMCWRTANFFGVDNLSTLKNKN